MKIFIRHPGGGELQPSTARVLAYKNFFESSGFAECILDVCKNKSTVKLWIDCVCGRYDAVILSMPPFRGWGLFFLPFTRVVLDIRDGWSIAIASGYGGNVPIKNFRAKIARMIERWAIRRAFVAITCTTGLQDYLQKISGRKVLLIPNGIGDDDFQLIEKVKNNFIINKVDGQVVFCCAGQFSEYGESKARKVLEVIAQRYAFSDSLIIRLIGCDPQKNQWACDFFKKLTNGKGCVEILKTMQKQQLYEAMISCDYGISLLRDPDYEFGTKVFDYIALGLPVVNYFDSPNRFTDYFDGCLDVPFNGQVPPPEIRRSVLIKNMLESLEW